MGSYKLEFQLFDLNRDDSGCSLVNFEASIVPKTILLQRKTDYGACPSQSNLPEKIFNSNIIAGTYQYSSLDDPSSYVVVHRGKAWIKEYTFTLQQITGRNGLWNFKAALSFNFITSSSLRLILGHTVNDSCIQQDGGCITSVVSYQINQAVIKAILVSGVQYSLWIYNDGQEDRSIVSCTPVSISVDLQPSNEDLNPINCQASNPPESVNVPGLMDNFGFLDYQETLVLSPITWTKIELSTQSFIRVHVPAHKHDIDMKITNRNKTTIAASTGLKSENLLLELDPGQYLLNVYIFQNNLQSNPIDFCETYGLIISIAPTSSVSRDYCFDGDNHPKPASSPDFAGFQMAVKDSPYEWKLTPGENEIVYYFPIPSTSGISNALLFSKQFTTDTPLAIKIEIGANFLISGLTLWLSDDERPGRPHLVDSKHEYNPNRLTLVADLQQGTYTLRVATESLPVAAIRTIKSNDFPPCIQYSMTFEVKALVNKDSCWASNTLPASLLIPGYLLDQSGAYSTTIPSSKTKVFTSETTDSIFSECSLSFSSLY